jgi:uncharacterized protein (DUF488 family)
VENIKVVLNWKQKILLNLLTALDNKRCSRLQIFKLSFLLSQKTNFYDFVPYKYGPYSFEMDKDLRMFNNNGWINMNKNLIYTNYNLIKLLPIEIDHEYELHAIINKFSNVNEKNLLDFIYERYPFYTKNSVLVKEHKSKEQVTPVAIYTIGYQNLSIDSFISILIEKNIKTVLDVRNKPFSYKYGFNYSWLKKYLPEFNIEYINIPELGIQEKYRKTFSCKKLWEYYYALLDRKKLCLNRVSNFMLRQPSVLMCYEMFPEDCHRLRLAERIRSLTNLPIVNFDTKKRQWIRLDY